MLEKKKSHDYEKSCPLLKSFLRKSPSTFTESEHKKDEITP